MFGNEVTRHWVQGSGEKARQQKKVESIPAKNVYESKIESELRGYIKAMPHRWLLRPYKTGTKSIEENLESAERNQQSSCFFPDFDILTYQKKAFPKTWFRQMSSIRVGRSVSIPSSPIRL